MIILNLSIEFQSVIQGFFVVTDGSYIERGNDSPNDEEGEINLAGNLSEKNLKV